MENPNGTGAKVLTNAEVEARVEVILAGLSLSEKVGQLTQVGGTTFIEGPKPEDVIRRGGAGSVLWLNDTQKFNALQRIAVEESPSGIPLLFALDVIHGYRTIFPVPLAMAASWDPTVPERAQAVAAKEARAAGLHWTFGPMLDIARDARWGRIVEGAGEDPHLGAAMAAAQVRGFQGIASARRIGSWPARSTSPATAHRTAGGTTIRSICRKDCCATCISRRSMPLSRQAWGRS
ncbi:MAG: hypothetical protein HND48_02410 [Chloroflexi bacterium]|nr:hypothetical protein [Chloroflexota bacterium]